MEIRAQETKAAYVATRVLDTPFWGLYNLLPFILYRDLEATPFQIALLVTLKPLSSFLSSFWGGFVYGRPDRLVSSIVWARLLAALPYFFFPWIANPWLFIGAHAFYMMLSVGTVPAWMEILKQNLPEKVRSSLFSYCQAFGYLGGGLFPLVTGFLLDGFHESWRWLFPLFGLFTLIPIFFQLRMSVLEPDKKGRREKRADAHFKAVFWDSISLLKTRKEFFSFQMAFMALGSALMILQPALPLYFVDTLHLSYTDMALAITLSKGVGYVIASPFLSRFFSAPTFFGLAVIVAHATAFFPLLLLLSQLNFHAIFFAYLVYGIVQSGSEFLWNMSGPTFSREKDSSLFSTVNITMVGIRGALIPPLGSLLLLVCSPSWMMVISSILCVMGGSFLWHRSGFGQLQADHRQP